MGLQDGHVAALRERSFVRGLDAHDLASPAETQFVTE